MLKEIWGNAVDWTKKTEIKNAEFLPVGEAAKLHPDQLRAAKRTLDSSGFSAEGTLISAFAVPRSGNFLRDSVALNTFNNYIYQAPVITLTEEQTVS